MRPWFQREDAETTEISAEKTKQVNTWDHGGSGGLCAWRHRDLPV